MDINSLLQSTSWLVKSIPLMTFHSLNLHFDWWNPILFQVFHPESRCQVPSPPRHDCGPSTVVKKQPTQQGEDWFLVPQASKPRCCSDFFLRYVKKNESCKKTEIYRWLKIIDRNIRNNDRFYCIIQTSCNYSPISIRIPDTYLIEIMTLLYLCNIISDDLSKRNNILIWVLLIYLFGGYVVYISYMYMCIMEM